MIWLDFIISAFVIIASGIVLTRLADKLSEDFEIGKVWIGVVLLGVVTSLPEAVTSLFSIISVRSPDLAVGNLFGSNNFNPLLIVVMDIFYRRGAITNDIVFKRPQKIVVSFAFLLSLFVLSEMLLHLCGVSFRFGFLSGGSIFLFVLYIAGVKMVATSSAGQTSCVAAVGNAQKKQASISLFKIISGLAVCALLIVFAAMRLAHAADVIALETGLGQTFVGSLFLAIVTSLPEMVVSLSALQLGAFDLAIGNIFGSNMANLFIIAICDVFYKKGALLSAVSSAHFVTLGLSLLLMSIIVFGVRHSKKVVFGIGLDSLLMAGCFLIGNGILFYLR
ncbi:sodium:calcium antiporter [Candidatus Omnitrophota bacterium]